MCIAVIGKVIKIYDSENAIIECFGVTKKVNVTFIDNVTLGDYLLIHVGFAIEKIDKKEGEETINIFKDMITE